MAVNGLDDVENVPPARGPPAGTLPDDHVERLARIYGRPRAVVTDEGLVFYEPGSVKPPAIAAGDKQQDRVDWGLMRVEVRRQQVWRNSRMMDCFYFL